MGRARPISDAQVLRLRMRSQLLAGRRANDVGAVVRRLGGIPAQSTPSSRLAVRPRSGGLDAAAVIRACNEERMVVRTWAMRGTLHMLAAEDVGWVVGLLGPRFAAAGRGRRTQLGLDDEAAARSLPAIREVLAGGDPLTRAELVQRVRDRGVRIDPSGQAPAHLVAFAAMQGLICRGPDLEDDEPTYVLLEEWVGRAAAREPEDALTELARRYVRAHAPTTPEDFAAWAGIPVGVAREGFGRIDRELTEVGAGDTRMWIAAGTRWPPARPTTSVVRLPASFDPYLLGYRSRGLMLASRFAKRIQAGGGWIHPAVVIDGHVVGTWRERRRGDEVEVSIAPFSRLSRAVLPALEAEAADLGRFVGAEARLTVRPAG